MTVVTPGGPCLTQTQIFRNEQQEAFLKKQETQNVALQNPNSIEAQKADKITSLEKTDNNPQSRLSYGAPGDHLVDIIV